MKDKMRDSIKLFYLWIFGSLGGIFFSFLKSFRKIGAVGHQKFISLPDGIVMAYNQPFSWKPIIFPSPLLIIIKKNHRGRLWLFPVIESNEKGWRGIRRFIQRIKKARVIILTADRGIKDGEDTPKVRRFQSGTSISSDGMQVITSPVWTEENEDILDSKSFLNDRFFFLSLFSTDKRTSGS
jgi:hypothetical protein